MPDQDFNIKVVTTADTSGLKQVDAAIDATKAKAAAGPDAATLAARQASLRSALTPVPAGLVGLEAPPIQQLEKEMEKVGSASLFAGANLAKARQEAAFLVRELATGVPSTRTLSSLMGSLGPALAGAAVAGFGLNKAIRAYGEYQLKITQDLDIHLTKLTEIQKKWSEAAKSTTSFGDLGKLTSSFVPAIEAAADKAREFQNQGQSTLQSYVNTLSHLPGTAGVAFQQLGNIMQQMHDQEGARLQQEYNDIREQAQAAANLGEEYRKSFNAEKTKPFSEAVSDLTGKIKEQTDLAATHFKNQDILSYTKAIDHAERYKSQLRDIIGLEEERATLDRLSSPELDANLSKISQITDELRALNVQTDDLNAAFEKGVSIEGAQGEKIRQLVLQLQAARNIAAQVGVSDLFKGPFTAQQDSFNKQREFQAEIARRREEAAEGIGQEVSESEKKKFFQEDELRQLQRKQALQRSLIPEGADQAEIQKRLGTEGLKDFEQRAERIKQLQKDLGNVPKEEQPLEGGPVAGVGESQEKVNEIERNRRAAEAQAKLIDEAQGKTTKQEPTKPENIPPKEETLAQPVIKAIERLESKFDRYWS